MKEKTKICKGCGHSARFHYVGGSPSIVGSGHIVCSKDNCNGWQYCEQTGWRKEQLLGKNK